MHSSEEAPLHSRFDEREALETAEARYRVIRERIPSQVRLLQDSPGFRTQCRTYYEEGRPDWSILLALYSSALILAASQRAQQTTELGDPGALRGLEALVEEDPVPAHLFTEGQMRRAFAMQPASILESWGFDLRTKDLRPGKLEWFIKQRLPVFAYDPPHEPMFGEPPGDWPDV
jgi:hypothetical protein